VIHLYNDGVLTGGALAATGAWRPILGNPATHQVPTGTSRAPTPSDATTTLGVLRRPQNDGDRSAVTEAMLRDLGPENAGVRLDSVRLVTERTVRPTDGEPELNEPVCLLAGPPGGWTCASTTTIRARGLVIGSGVHLIGLVPDGVVRVRLTYPRPPGAPAPAASPRTPPPLPEMPSSVQWLNADGDTIGPTG